MTENRNIYLGANRAVKTCAATNYCKHLLEGRISLVSFVHDVIHHDYGLEND